MPARESVDGEFSVPVATVANWIVQAWEHAENAEAAFKAAGGSPPGAPALPTRSPMAADEATKWLGAELAASWKVVAMLEASVKRLQTELTKARGGGAAPAAAQKLHSLHEEL